MTRDERLLFVGMITIADDEGRLVASPAHLLGAIYPHDTNITPAKVRAWRDAVCEKNPNAQLYESGGRDYIALVPPCRHRYAALPLDQVDSIRRPHSPQASSPASRYRRITGSSCGVRGRRAGRGVRKCGGGGRARALSGRRRRHPAAAGRDRAR